MRLFADHKSQSKPRGLGRIFDANLVPVVRSVVSFFCERRSELRSCSTTALVRPAVSRGADTFLVGVSAHGTLVDAPCHASFLESFLGGCLVILAALHRPALDSPVRLARCYERHAVATRLARHRQSDDLCSEMGVSATSAIYAKGYELERSTGVGQNLAPVGRATVFHPPALAVYRLPDRADR